MAKSESAHSGTDLLDQAFEWVVLMTADQVSENDRLAFRDWQSQSMEHAVVYQQAERLWRELGQVAQTEPLPQAKRRKRNPGGLVVLALVSSMALSEGPRFFDRWRSDYYTDVGEQKEITLPDGSHVLLDTDTVLRLAFTAQCRCLSLQRGQARFDVARDATRAFDVESRDIHVRALGTVFAVDANAKTGVGIAVQEHAVEVIVPTTPFKIKSGPQRIDAGHYVQTDSVGTLHEVQERDLASATAWQRRQWVFKHQLLQQVVDELGRYHRGGVLILDDGLKRLQVSGVFPIDDPDAVLHSIEQTLHIKAISVGPWRIFLHAESS